MGTDYVANSNRTAADTATTANQPKAANVSNEALAPSTGYAPPCSGCKMLTLARYSSTQLGYQGIEDRHARNILALGWGLFWLAAIVLTLGIALIPLAIVAYLTFFGADQRALAAGCEIETVLMPSETLWNVTIQHRVFCLWARRKLLAITNNRVLVMDRKVLGGYAIHDMQWKDLVDARISQNVLAQYCGSNLAFRFDDKDISVGKNEKSSWLIEGLASDDAARIYSLSQSQEQAWEEKRRVRTMEENRSRSGGIHLHSGGAGGGSGIPAFPSGPTALPSPEGTLASSRESMLSELQRAKTLLDADAISDVEFQEMKAKILSTI